MLYCPPMALISDLLCDIKLIYPTAKIFLGGGFNSSGISWSDGTLTESYAPVPFREKLIDIIEEFHLKQLVLEPTQQNNILYLCFTTHSSTVISSQTSRGLSDHELL